MYMAIIIANIKCLRMTTFKPKIIHKLHIVKELSWIFHSPVLSQQSWLNENIKTHPYSLNQKYGNVHRQQWEHELVQYTLGHPNKMFRFLSPSLSWRWVGWSGTKRNEHMKGSECQWRLGCPVRKLGYVVLSFLIRWY